MKPLRERRAKNAKQAPGESRPRPPPVCAIALDLLPVEELGQPAAVFGQYPPALIGKMLPWLCCARSVVLHVCSGALPPGEGVDYPRPSHLLAEAGRVVRPGGRIIFVHYFPPKPPAGCNVLKVYGLSTGFGMPMRAVTVYQREQGRLL